MPEEVPRPDNDVYNAKQAALKSDIEKAQAERERLSDIIGQRGQSSSGVVSESKQARDRLNEIR
jgi:hypothetical protein